MGLEAITALSTEELEQVRLQRMTSLEETERYQIDLAGSGDYEAVKTPAEMIEEGKHTYNTGGYDEILQKPQHEIDGLKNTHEPAPGDPTSSPG